MNSNINVLEEASALFEKYSSALNLTKNNLNENFTQAFELLLNVKGRIIFSGVGKSGHIGKKAAASFASTGNISLYVDPVEALHGDLGMIGEGDCIVLLSHSGNTQEMVNLLPSLRHFNVKTIAITSNDNSKLAKFCDVHINTCVKEEICPHNLAPTTSTTITLAILDILMVLLMKEKEFEKEQFALFHPAGSLGKKLLLKVEDIVERNAFSVSLQNSFLDVIDTMSSGGKGIVPVVENENIIGIITDGDVRRSLETYKGEVFDKSVEFIMTKNPKIVNSNELAVDVLNLMETYNITAIPVVENEKYIGVISIHDILKEGLR